MRVNKLIVVFIVTGLFNNCNFKPKYSNVDDYYVRYAGWDYARIPLQKPFELYYLKANNGWYINTSKLEIGLEDALIPNVLGDFGIIDLIFCDSIYIYCHKLAHTSQDTNEINSPELWFLVDLEKQKFIHYIDQQEFTNFVNLRNFEQMKSPDFYFKIFKNDRILPWFNDTIKESISNWK